MAAPRHPQDNPINPEHEESEEEAMLDADDALEEINDEDGDHPMDSDAEDDAEQEIQLQNDSIAHFDLHKDSIFAITAHPLDPSIIATGSGDDTAYVFSTAGSSSPVLPASYQSGPSGERESLKPIAHLTGHKDSVNAIAFSLPNGEYLVTAGMDGKLRSHTCPAPANLSQGPYPLLAEIQEVEEITWLSPCPHPNYPNTFAFGAVDGSVWVYTVDAKSSPAVSVVQAYYLHTAPTTAGAWSASGSLLASVAEDSSLFVYDVFGDAASANISSTGQALVSLSADDQRFAVEGGLYSLAFAPNGTFLATGGAGGIIRIIGIPLLTTTASTQTKKKSTGKTAAPGQILTSLLAQSDSIESLSFSSTSATLASGSVDGSIILFDTTSNFAVRRSIKDAHDGEALVQVSFADKGEKGYILTSSGLDGVVRRWDTRGGSNAAAGSGLVGEWKGHRGGGDGGGVLGFVVGDGKVVTAGDDGVGLVFDVGRA